MNQAINIPGFNEITNADLGVEITMTKGNTIVLMLKGYIDTYNTPFLSKKVNMAITHGFSNFIFDMRGITYMSSTALGIFTSILKSLKPIGGTLIFVGVNPKVYDIFELIGFSKFFQFASDITVALTKLEKSVKVDQGPTLRIFPKKFRCSCKKNLSVSRSGKYQCPQCRIIISVSDHGALKRV